ncbi:hypothetical protein AVEN_29160-1 [Araneus ventricosus]|uniref:Retrotransposon gag domain-containing protein n=1 Tax=Araneus ventricosus TaxID=182803 RepID=A0A4Y2AMG6_ARAVE|nr:hypothetical protein AVEN_29160-1 [Araneus ventricosus]
MILDPGLGTHPISSHANIAVLSNGSFNDSSVALPSELQQQAINQRLADLPTNNCQMGFSSHDVNLNALSPNCLPQPSFHFSIKDIEDTVKKFNGKDSYSVNLFLANLDDLFVTYNIQSNVSKMLLTKKSLLEPAKIFVSTLRNMNSFEVLKQNLTTEFGTKISSLDIHRLLMDRKLKRTETIVEYFIAIRQIAAHGNIDDLSLFEYVTNGLPDCPHKFLLYGAKHVAKYKEKLTCSEKLLNQRSNTFPFNERRSHTPPQRNFPESRRDTRQSDRSNSVKNIVKQRNKHIANHVSKDCPLNNNRRYIALENVVQSQNSLTKPIKIQNFDIDSLIDTGSQKTLLRHSINN